MESERVMEDAEMEEHPGRADLALVAPTPDVIRALREQLLPSLAFGQVLSAYVHGTPMAVLGECTRWSLLWDHPSEAGMPPILSAALCQDLRDRRLSLFGRSNAAEKLMVECPEAVYWQTVNMSGEGTFYGVESSSVGATISALKLRVGHIAYDEPYEAWILVDEQKLIHANLKDLAEGFYDDSVKESDAEIINSKWPYSSATSLATIKECIINRPSACIRKRNEEGEDEIISWSLVRAAGQIGMTYTAEAYRSQGLAKRVVVQLCKKLMALRDGLTPQVDPGNNHGRPWTPYCYIDPHNAPSSNMFAGLGFVKAEGRVLVITMHSLGRV